MDVLLESRLGLTGGAPAVRQRMLCSPGTCVRRRHPERPMGT
ncbi:MAG TPA: hypothetical protein VFD49_20930 [Candidatus Dormibacteraeota bacterium]|nr:hypothetical protein [Candidatus Dormibacteraeota bacterium]